MVLIEEQYMWRAIQLARCGEGRVSPNPLVGAVIVAHGKIIGEGYHARFGGPHAEVNAISSVKKKDEHLFSDSTIYVTLEPCSHFGKTPPCANLIISKGIQNVVIGSPDPNPLVAGRGVRMLREAGCKVIENVLLEECLELNKRFMTFHSMKRPWIILKWAQSADGFMAGMDDKKHPFPIKFSTPLSSVWMHRERANVDGIIVGSNTLKIDNPRLDVRFWGGKNPKTIVSNHEKCEEIIERLYAEGISSLMVEGGPTILKSFIESGLFDEIRIETKPILLVHGLPSPRLPEDLHLKTNYSSRGNIIATFSR